MRLRDLSFRGLAVLTGLVILVPDIFMIILALAAYFISPESLTINDEFSLGFITYAPESIIGYFGVMIVSLLLTILWVLILVSILSIILKRTRLGNIWIARVSEEQLRMRKTFN